MARSRANSKVAAPAAEVEMSDAGSSDWEIDHNEPEQQPASSGRKAAPVLEKDSDEEDLERLVLGDRAGFRAQLFGGSGDLVGDAGRSLEEMSLAVKGGDDSENDAEDNPFEDAEDAHMFLYDESMQPHTSLELGSKLHKTTSAGSGPDANAPAWEDSDDERLVVSLAGRTQLRKLRRFEGEDVVNGTVYAARLRQQYLRLNPQPGWAAEADKALQQRLQQQNGATAAKKDKKDRKEKKKDKRRRKSAASDDDNDLSDEVRHSDSDSNLDAASDTSDSSDDDNDSGYDLVGAALPLDALLRSASAMASASQMLFAQGGGAGGDRARRLRPEVIDIQKTRDIPTQHAGPVGSLSFHPAYNVLLSSSVSSVLHLHQVAPGAHPTPNPLLTSVRVYRTPVRCSAFLTDAASASASDKTDSHQVVFAGRRPYFHTWDLVSGKVQKISRVQGHGLEHRSMERFRLSPAGTHMALIATDRKRGGIVNVLNVQTMQWVAQARHESVGGVADLQWWRDGSGMTILGRDGRVGEWSLETRRFVGVWRDDGSTGGTVLALGGGQVGGQTGGPDALGGDRWVAIGSKTGITNLYNRASLLVAGSSPATVATNPTPLRVLEQLITPVTSIAFTPDGQLMAFASKHKRDALRLVHLPSATVYRNWPTSKTPLGRITAVAFGRDSDFLAVGNDTGKTRLWEIRG
ncbi:U3 snoRNP protein [Sporothrix curviconia]|uniref:U3 snoRNP protein n=1 Tax=Sporothrix curviconia TaxID=1260050 RepID=A0ABP0BP36_9PEZI